MKSAAASGRRRRAGRAPWRLPEQSHGSNEVNDGGDGFVFVLLLIRVSPKPYSTQRVRKRGGEGGAKMWVWGGRHC